MNYRSILLTACISLTLCGCAGLKGPASNWPESYKKPIDVSSGYQIESAPSILFSISYPARITDRAASAYKQRYMSSHFVYPEDSGLKKNYNALDDAILKTAYLSHELMRSLAEKIPKEKIIILPGTIDFDGKDFTYSVPDYKIPALVYVDVFSYRSPQNGEAGIPLVGTYEERVNMMLEAWASPGSTLIPGDILIANERLPIKLKNKASRPSVLLSIISKRDSEASISDHITRDIPAENKILVLPLTEVDVSGEAFNAHFMAGSDSRPIHGRELFSGLTNVLLDSLNRINVAEAAKLQRQNYVSIYDSKLDLSTVPISDPRVVVLRQFEAIESKMLSATSQEALSSLFEGEWGNSMRQRFILERESVEKNNQAAMMMFAGAMLTMGALGPMAWSPLAAVTQMENLSNSMDLNNNPAFGLVTEKQKSIVINSANMTEKITANSIDELRTKLISLYAKNFNESKVRVKEPGNLNLPLIKKALKK